MHFPFGDPSGFLLIDKPAGISSFGAIEAIQRALLDRARRARQPSSAAGADGSEPLRGQNASPRGRDLPLPRKGDSPLPRKGDLPKLGHGGTLDPFATGLLVVGIGEGVKLTRYLLASRKTYSARMRFGETTRSGDFSDLARDPVCERSERVPASLAELRAATAAFTSAPYPQIPPMHSAKQIDGKRLYELAREGIEVEREAKLCTVYRFEIGRFGEGPSEETRKDELRPLPRAEFVAEVSAGTFIRTLAQDFARKLGSVGALETLRRTASGSFSVERAIPLAELEAWIRGEVASGAANGGGPDRAVARGTEGTGDRRASGGEAATAAPDWNALAAYTPLDRCLDFLPKIALSDVETLHVRQGKSGEVAAMAARANLSPETERAVLADSRGKLVAVIARDERGVWKIERGFGAAASEASPPQATTSET